MLPSDNLDDFSSVKNLTLLREMINVPGGNAFILDWDEPEPGETSVCFIRKNEPHDVVLQDLPSSSSSGLHLGF